MSIRNRLAVTPSSSQPRLPCCGSRQVRGWAWKAWARGCSRSRRCWPPCASPRSVASLGGQRGRTILQFKGAKLFALIDHSGEAEKAGPKMPPTKLLIFGNPKGGTPLMLAAPSVAIDLPLKILVAEVYQVKRVDILQQP